MPNMVALLFRRRWLLVTVSIGWFGGGCSSTATATGPGATGAAQHVAPPVGATGTTASDITAPPPATCALAMQNVNKHWETASLQANADVQAIYANAGSKLTPVLVALCQTDAWSPTGRTCVAHAANLAAVDVCTRDFSASQQAHLQATTAEIIDTVDLSIRPVTPTGAPQL